MQLANSSSQRDQVVTISREMTAAATGIRQKRHAMGCMWEAVVWGASVGRLRDALEDAFVAVEQAEALFSRYRATSEISRFNCGTPGVPHKFHPEVVDLVAHAAAICEFTRGAFDITTAPLVRLWGFETGHYSKPTQEDICAILKTTGMQHVTVNRRDRTMSRDVDGVEMNLGGVGKGYGADQALTGLRDCGLPGAMISAGSSTLAAFGTGPGGSPWTVALRHPVHPERVIRQICLRDESISTSGSAEQFFLHEGIRFTHIIDPRTGWPAQWTGSVSVMCESAAASDAFATAAFVLGPEAFQEIADAEPDLKWLFIDQEGRELAGNIISPTQEAL